MKPTHLILGIAVMGTGLGMTIAQDDESEKKPQPAGERPERPQRGGGGPGGGGGGFLEQLDTNKDGEISKEEAGDRWDRMSRLDTDGNGVIGKKEMEAMAQGRGRQGGGRPGGGGAGMFEEADKNGDGKLSKDELPEEAWARIGEADKDGDGAVTREEIAALYGGRRPGGQPGEGGQGGGPGRFFEMADKNKDGKITADEAGDRWDRMSQLDKNSDGAITKDELPQMGQGGGRPPEGGQGGGPGRFFEMADKNKDGKITADEAGDRWDRMSQLDKNSDGAITKDELPQMGQGGGRPGGKPGEGDQVGRGGQGGGGSGAIFGQYDKNEDDKLSKDEVSEQMWERLSKADKNADGLVSKEELSGVYSDARGGGGGNDGPAKKKRPEVE